MSIAIATAPCCWGIEKGDRPGQPAWTKVLDEAAAAGYAGLELGPLDFMPRDPARLGPELQARGLSLVAGTIFDDLASEANRARLLADTDAICSLLAALPRAEGQPAPFLTVMDFGADDRDFDAGHPERARRLSDAQWAVMVENITQLATLARDRHGIRAVIHPHAGGFIEFEDEITRILQDIPADVAGLCLDTGHSFYGRMDPVEALTRWADRLDYVHFKDIDPQVFERVMGERIRFFEACGHGVMCPIGDGCIDYPAIRSLLDQLGYQGFITIEQERDPKDAGGTLRDLKRSRAYLASAGF